MNNDTFQDSLRRHQRSHRSRRSASSKEQKEPFVLIAFQTACIALIFLNATFIGDVFFHMLEHGFSHLYLFLILIAAFNVVEIMNNWVSIEKFFNDYTMFTFAVDVITLGIFYWQIHILSKNLNKFISGPADNIQSIALEKLVFGFWIAIFICYIVWNFRILFKQNKKSSSCKNIQGIKELKNSTVIRIIQSIIALLLILYVDSECGLVLYAAAFILYALYHNKDLNIFDTLIKMNH